MLIDELKQLGMTLRTARKDHRITQQQLSDKSHVSTKQIANIERGKMNSSYLILKALAKVIPLSLDSLINLESTSDDKGIDKMKVLYLSCPQEMREILLRHTQEFTKELIELSEKFQKQKASE